MGTKVVNLRQEPYDVYIGRGSKWGNPFSWAWGTIPKFKVQNRAEAIQKYDEWLLNKPGLLADLHELKGKTLGCYCYPAPCHGDVLVKLVEYMT